MRILITLLAAVAAAAPAAAQLDEFDEIDQVSKRILAERDSATRWTKTDTGVISIVAAAVVAATALDYTSCGVGFKAKDHPVYGTHCMQSVQTPEGERTLTYNTKVALRGGCTMTEDGEKCGEIGKRMLWGSLGLAMLGVWLIRTDDDNPVTKNLEAGVAPGEAVVTKSFGW